MAKLIRRLFEDRRTGEIVVGQSPNFMMILCLSALGARVVLRSRALDPTLRAAQNGSFLLWSLDEMVRGVNPFRRIGGAVLLFGVALGRGHRSFDHAASKPLLPIALSAKLPQFAASPRRPTTGRAP